MADSRHQPTVRPQRLALGVLARAPIAGAVKRRLSPPLSPARAAELSSALLSDLIGVLTLLPMGYRAVLCESDTERETLRKTVPPRWQMATVGSAPIEKQIEKGLEHLFATGVEAGGMLTSDTPLVSLDELYEGFMWLTKRRGLLLGPTKAGGIYLVAMTHAEPALFTGLDWSSTGVVNRLKERAAELKIETQVISTVPDVETAADLKEFVKEMREGANKPIGGLPACTALLANADFTFTK